MKTVRGRPVTDSEKSAILGIKAITVLVSHIHIILLISEHMTQFRFFKYAHGGIIFKKHTHTYAYTDEHNAHRDMYGSTHREHA